MIRFPKYLLPLLAAGLLVYFVLLFLTSQYEWEIGRLDVLVELFTLPAIAAVPVLLVLGILAVGKTASQRTAANYVGIGLLLVDLILLVTFTFVISPHG